MDRSIRYEPLQTDEEDQPATHMAVMMVVPPDEPPPPLAVTETAEVNTETAVVTDETTNNDSAVSMVSTEPLVEPPSYNVATTLPTYEEAERSKAEEAERQDSPVNPDNPDQESGLLNWHQTKDVELGTDGMFLCTFMIAFLFNWVGLLVSICLTHTIAGRLGGVAGFGLSMVKWVAILKHSNWPANVPNSNWLWWLLIILGFLIFFRACTQYIRIKYQWRSLADHMRRRVYFYF